MFENNRYTFFIINGTDGLISSGWSIILHNTRWIFKFLYILWCSESISILKTVMNMNATPLRNSYNTLFEWKILLWIIILLFAKYESPPLMRWVSGNNCHSFVCQFVKNWLQAVSFAHANADRLKSSPRASWINCVL